MASMGQLMAGIAHEINNPVNFISIGIEGLDKNFMVYKRVLEAYEALEAKDNLSEKLAHIEEIKADNEFGDVKIHVSDLMSDIKLGADRTADIVKSLRNFSRADSEGLKQANIHELLDNTATIIRNQCVISY